MERMKNETQTQQILYGEDEERNTDPANTLWRG